MEEATADQRARFGAAVRRRLDDRDGGSMAWLAEQTGVSREAVRKWVVGEVEPPPARAFAIEDALDAVGQLTPLLGYQRVDPVEVAGGVREALEADPTLDADQVAIVLDVYEGLRSKGRSGGQEA